MILQILVPKVSIPTRSVIRDTLVHIAMSLIHILRYTDIKKFRLSDKACLFKEEIVFQ